MAQRGRLVCLLLLLPALLWRGAADHARSQYPARPIKLVVPFAPGGGSDAFARVMKRAIDEHRLLPQPLVIINVDGAGATIGSRRVKNARPDGYTILLLHEAIVTAKYYGSVPYGPEAFEPIAGTGKMGLVIVVRDDAAYNDLGDLMRAAQQRPETLVFSANLGAPTHFVGLMLQQSFPGAAFRFTQTGGGTKRLHDIMGGHADVTAFSMQEFLAFRSEGLRALAYCDRQRHPTLPEVPTSYEQGAEVTHVNMQFWWAPQNTPRERVDLLAAALEQAMRTPRVQAYMAEVHGDPIFVTGQAMRAEVEARRRAVSRVDLRPTQPLPNVPAVVLTAVGLLSLFVVAGALRRSAATWSARRREWRWPPPPARLATLCAAWTIAYALLLTLGLSDFRPLTLIYVLAVGGELTRWSPRHWGWLIALALTMSFGIYYLFTYVFDPILP